MSLSDALRLLAKRWLLLLLVPVVLSGATYFFARHLPKTYGSSTTIYTGIASGYSLTGNVETDMSSTTNAFDNLINLIKARSTKEEVIYRLLANHLWQTAQRPELLAVEPYKGLQENLPLDLRKQLIGPTQLATLQNVHRFAQADNTNVLYRLLNSNDPTYSLAALASLTVTRINSSDLITLEFESYNPELCQYTLTLMTEVFLEQSKNLRGGQTASVIQYYEAELSRAKARLAAAESENLAFNRANNIINYDEQSKNVAAEKETLASDLNLVSQEYAGAKAALRAVERKMSGSDAALLGSEQVLEQRQKLSKLNSTIADQQLFSQQQEGGNAVKVSQLQSEANKIAQSIQRSVDNYYTRTTSTEGVSSRDLLTQWVQDMVLVESTGAKLAVMKRRQQEFDQEYQRMAPLGATLKRLEREIGLAEQAYLAVLTSLNASKASQQNTQLMANLKIIDSPSLASDPKSNKLLLLVLLSGVSGFVFTVGLVLGLGLLDKTLRNPSIAARQIGLPIAGIMLDVDSTPSELLQASRQRNLNQLVRQILLKAHTLTPSPFVVGIFSMYRQEGDAKLCQALSERCQEMGIKVLALYPNNNEDSATSKRFDVKEQVPSLFYPADAAAVRGWSLNQLVQNAVSKSKSEVNDLNAQVILVELPALREESLPAGVLSHVNLAFLTVPATREWSPNDHQAVEYLRANMPAPVEVVLTRVASYYAEETSS
jgi:succinoglycan biosynthesis transport protein ExoP